MKRRVAISCLLGVSALLGARPATSGQSISKADTPLKVADVLDCFVQKRFEKADGRLGVSRMVTILGHDRVRLYPETEDEKKLMALAKSAGRPFTVSFLHCDVPPSKMNLTTASYPQYTSARRSSPKPFMLHIGMDMMTPPYVNGRSEEAVKANQEIANLANERWRPLAKEMEPIGKRATAEIPRLKKNERIDFTQGDYTVALRPVIARSSGCISCHAQSKLGDTLGVMVYAVSNKIANPSSASVRTARLTVTK